MNSVNLELKQLFEDNAPKLVNYFIKRNLHAVNLYDTYEDMRQSLLLKVWRMLPRYDEQRSKFTTFVFCCCRTEVSMRNRFLRAKKRDGVVVGLEDEICEGFTIMDTIEDNTDVYQDIEVKELLNKAIALFSEENHLYYINNVKMDDIALILGFSQAHISRKIRKNINDIKRELKVYGDEL